MGKTKIITISAMLLSACMLSAEPPKQWTLKGCIDYALEHNIEIRTGKLDVMSAAEGVSEAKARLFPSLSFSTTHHGGCRPFADGSGGYDDKGSYSGDYGLNANWTCGTAMPTATP